MAHKTMVDATAYEISGGKVLDAGTAYDIDHGRVMDAGTVYDIEFQNGTPVGDLSIGASVYLNVKGAAKEFIVVHQGKPSNLYDDSCTGTWLLMKDIYESRQWNSSNSNSYKASTIHSYLNSTFLNLFDADIKAQIKTVKIPYVNGTGDSNVASGSNGLSARIFLLSGFEVGFDRNASVYFPYDGDTLSYFEKGYSSQANEKRIAKMNGSVTTWWLRSPYTYRTKSAWKVIANGRWSDDYCTNSNGVRPALVLPSDALVDERNHVI